MFKGFPKEFIRDEKHSVGTQWKVLSNMGEPLDLGKFGISRMTFWANGNPQFLAIIITIARTAGIRLTFKEVTLTVQP